MEYNNLAEPIVKVPSEERKRSTPFDDVFRTLVTKFSKSLIPVVNEMFSLDVPKEAEVQILNDIHFLGKQKLETDSIFKIDDHYYHVECESQEGKFGVRFIEYDFIIAIESIQRKEDGAFHLQFPRSGILMLRNNSKTPDKERIVFHFPDGKSKELSFSIMKAKSYDIDMILKKELYFLIPFYILRYELKKSSKEYDREIVEKQVLDGMKEILDRFSEDCTKKGNLELFYDIRELTHVIGRHLIKGPHNRKEVDNMGRGKVLELPSDRVRAAEARAEEAEAKAEAKAEANAKARIEEAEAKAEARVKILEERLRQYGEDPALLYLK